MTAMTKTLWAAIVCACVSTAQATVVIDTASVGNPGNVADTRYVPSGRGAVAYTFDMGKFEITAEQYTAFLMAVAGTDTYGLYNTFMSSEYGCGIQRGGQPGNYTYTVASDWAHRPVNYVSWGDAARFANWLYHGQPTGGQNLGTTEDGSYYLNGATSNTALLAVTRKANATWVIPSEDEWYKAAYHQKDAATERYWDYPTGTNDHPGNALLDPDPGNNANFHLNGDYTIGGPYWRTEVGDFEKSASPYGTFDQGGNVYEWNETLWYPSYRGARGGAYADEGDGTLRAQYSNFGAPTLEVYSFGFRVAAVPEPASLTMLALGLLAMFRRR